MLKKVPKEASIEWDITSVFIQHSMKEGWGGGRLFEPFRAFWNLWEPLATFRDLLEPSQPFPSGPF